MIYVYWIRSKVHDQISTLFIMENECRKFKACFSIFNVHNKLWFANLLHLYCYFIIINWNLRALKRWTSGVQTRKCSCKSSFSNQSCRSSYARLYLRQRPFYKILVKVRNSKRELIWNEWFIFICIDVYNK